MKHVKIILCFLFIGILSSSEALAEKLLASKSLIKALTEEVSGEIAFNYTVYEYLKEKLGGEILKTIKLRGYAAYKALNFVDGHRSIFDIARAVLAEYGPLSIKKIHEFFKMLEKAELVTLKNI